MRCVLSYPGVMDHAQNAALAFQDTDRLATFATAFVFKPGGGLDGLLNAVPTSLAGRARRQLQRRAVFPELADRVVSFPMGEIVRTVAAKSGLGPIAVDRIWDRAARGFDAAVARRLVPDCDLIAAFEYTAMHSFERAKALGRASLLHMPSLDSLAFKALQDRERAAWPELRHASDAYFEGRFAERYERRCREIALADVIIANSSLTKRSHAAAGANPDKIFVAPLAAPTPIVEARPAGAASAPMKVIWSGAFSLRKGAHYLLDAWRTLNPGVGAELRVYGEIGAPAAMMATAPADILFMGSAPRSTVLDAYAQADVLVFPSLSDGFGQSVSEALSRGVPVLTTDQVGAADLIEPGVNGLIVPAGDALALAEALRWCLDNRTALRDMRLAALATARRHQWPDYRHALNAATDAGLRRAGFARLVD